MTKGAAVNGIRDAINADRRKASPIVKDIGRDETVYLLERLSAEGKIRILDQGSRARTAACAAFPMLLSGISILR